MNPDTTPRDLEVLVPEHGTLHFHGAHLQAVNRSGVLNITRGDDVVLAVIRDWIYWRVVTAGSGLGAATL